MPAAISTSARRDCAHGAFRDRNSLPIQPVRGPSAPVGRGLATTFGHSDCSSPYLPSPRRTLRGRIPPTERRNNPRPGRRAGASSTHRRMRLEILDDRPSSITRIDRHIQPAQPAIPSPPLYKPWPVSVSLACSCLSSPGLSQFLKPVIIPHDSPCRLAPVVQRESGREQFALYRGELAAEGVAPSVLWRAGKRSA